MTAHPQPSPRFLRKNTAFLLVLAALLSLLATGRLSNAAGPGRAFAQDDAPGGEQADPVYVVQEGDTLWSIALRFGVSLEDLAQANGLGNDAFLKTGDRLVIPGLEGVHGELVTETIFYGETIQSLSRRYQVPISLFTRLNHLTSPAELNAGATLILPQGRGGELLTGRVVVAPGQSLLELAVLEGTDPWTLAATNALSGTWDVLPGDVLLTKSEAGEGPGALPGQIVSVELDPLPLVQGKTSVIRLAGASGLSIHGSLMGHELTFFEQVPGRYASLQGVHAMANPGLYPLVLKGALEDGTPFAFSQMVAVQDGQYLFDVPLEVPKETLDPAVTRPEDEEWFALTAPVTAEKMWDGPFEMPSPLPLDYCLETFECFSSQFGSRRSYNGSSYTYFHTGLDFYGGTGTEILAPAPGEVVFTGFLTVRGNATVVNHGWGVYSAYMHQSQIQVKKGDRVEAGQVIGLVGGTGRVQGPHLHWEIFVGGVQVEPLDWLQRSFP
jgi:murein DD-endopeptidase MepM/ murein hydrolase activator NlpD